jgi:hypothetical protein
VKYIDLQAFVTQLTNRPEIGTIAIGETQTKLYNALSAAHTSLQNDEFVDKSYGTPVRVRPEWQAQVFEDTGIDYVANGPGVLLTSLTQDANHTLKRITDVKYLHTGTTTSEYVPIEPATQEEIEWYKLSDHTEFGSHKLHRHCYHQRWFVDDGYLQLLFPSGRMNTDLTLSVRIYQQLPFYVQGTDHDYFSDVCWQALGYGAAYWAMIFIGEAEDAQQFKALFEEEAIKKIRADKVSAQGGQERNYRPPLATGRRY